jgi:hypothetical protein
MFKEREALFCDAWNEQKSMFRYVTEHRDYGYRDYEEQTYRKMRYLADLLSGKIPPENNLEATEYEPEITVEVETPTEDEENENKSAQSGETASTDQTANRSKETADETPADD